MDKNAKNQQANRDQANAAAVDPDLDSDFDISDDEDGT